MDDVRNGYTRITDSSEDNNISSRHLMKNPNVSESANNLFFSLNSHCILHCGEKGFAIYNLLSGDIIQLPQEKGKVIRLAEQGLNITEIASRMSIDVHDVYSLLDGMVIRDIGEFYGSGVYVEKLKKGIPSGLDIYLLHPPVINSCHIELPSKCSLGCSFCGQPSLSPCNMCSNSDREPNIKALEKFIERLFLMNVNSLTLYGGDPLTNIRQFISMVEFCRSRKFKGVIYVITNGTLIDDDIIKMFLRYGVHPIIPIIPGRMDFTKPIVDFPLLEFTRQANNVALPFTFVVLDFGNKEEITGVMKLITPMAPTMIRRVIILTSDDNKQYYIPESIPIINLTNRVNVDSYYLFLNHNPCLYGRFAVSASGEIFPCPYMKSEVLGNINTPDIIEEIFENRLIYKYWDMDFSQIDMCKRCELRYGCFDCRATEIRLTGKLYGKSLCIQKRY
jgi:radical SAM protein with 4Fe4S-binding SPASM domain